MSKEKTPKQPIENAQNAASLQADTGELKQAFVRGEWKREITPEEEEIKRKRSEAAKKAQETRKRKKEQAELAAQRAKQEFMQRKPTKQEAVSVKQLLEQETKIALEPIKEKEEEKPVEQASPTKEKTVETQEVDFDQEIEDEILTLDITSKKHNVVYSKKNKKAKSSQKATIEKQVKAEQIQQLEKMTTAENPQEQPLIKAAQKSQDKPSSVFGMFNKQDKKPKPAKDTTKKAQDTMQEQSTKAKPFFADKKPAVVNREIVKKSADRKKTTVGQTVINRISRKTKARKRLLHVKMLPILFVLENFFYEIGYFTEYAGITFLRVAKHIAAILVATFGKSFLTVIKPFRLFVMGAWHTIADPLHRVFRGFVNIKAVIRDEKEKGWKVATKEAIVYFKRGIKDYKHLAGNLALWSVSAICLLVFIITVSNTLSQQYVLELRVNDNIVGFVQNEETFEQAKQEIQKQLVYTNEEEQKDPWTISPVYNIISLGSQNVYNSDEVVTAILDASGKDIVKATGFYVDGQFYGATTDKLQLEQDIENFKAPYYDGDANTTIEFVQNVELADGVFLADSVVEYTAISSLLGSTKTGDVNYVIQKGDTLSGIAASNGITQNELLSINPQLDNGKATFYPGDNLLMQKAQAFLQVKVIKRVIETVEIPFAETTSQSGELAFGKRKITIEGQKGSKDVTSDVTYIDGALVDKTLVQEVVTKEPVTQEVIIGTYVAPGVVAVPGTGQMMWPVPAYNYMSRGFVGQYPAHNGVDICANYGVPIYASDSGVVTTAKYTSNGYGVHVFINHGNGLSTVYAHCSSLAVTRGQTVSKGQIIGYIGSTGWSTGNHCHYEIRVNNVPTNPMRYF